MCDAHWKELKAKLAEAGLDRFIAKNGQEAIAKMTAEDGFEPLMAANMGIFSNAIETAGLELMTPNDDGTERCPLCFLISGCHCGHGDKCSFKTWLDSAVAEQVDRAKQLGLIAAA